MNSKSKVHYNSYIHEQDNNYLLYTQKGSVTPDAGNYKNATNWLFLKIIKWVFDDSLECMIHPC